ncbi:MAG: dCTP deaminase [bacterium]|nr:dCTP deaminase [bacterium]
MILTRDAIQGELAAGRLTLDPFTPDQIGPASIDLHLGDEIRVMADGREPVAVTDDADYRTSGTVRTLTPPYVLQPGETILGITRERIRLPGDVAGWLEGRSRFARLGLMIHVTAGFIAPGVDSRQVLEMSNVAHRPLVIHAGVRLCQIVLQRCEGSAIYAGRFAGQDRP